MNGAADARRRWFGLLFLILAAGMTTWGLIFLDDHLRGLLFVAYWLVCFGCLLLSMAVAVVDFFIMRRRQREERSRLADRAIREAASAVQARVQGRRSASRAKTWKKPGTGGAGGAQPRGTARRLGAGKRGKKDLTKRRGGR